MVWGCSVVAAAAAEEPDVKPDPCLLLLLLGECCVNVDLGVVPSIDGDGIQLGEVVFGGGHSSVQGDCYLLPSSWVVQL